MAILNESELNEVIELMRKSVALLGADRCVSDLENGMLLELFEELKELRDKQLKELCDKLSEAEALADSHQVTLRDRLAMSAINSMNQGVLGPSSVAMMAYKLADACLLERAKR